MERRGADPNGEVSTVLSPKPRNENQELAEFSVVVAEGPDAGRRLPLDGSRASRLLIGQGATCDLRLMDRQVSRRHAALELSTDGVRLTDLESTNGTFVNGIRITEVFLVGGERISLGATVLQLVPQTRVTKTVASDAWRFGRMVGKSLAMRRLYALCERVAATEVSVVIEGETGTGKEVLAEALHDQGPRAGAPFVVFDCTAVPPTLLESALFGHERGAFTGAVAARRGVFEQAHGGTLFIDEIGELETSLQPKLLRAIERSEVQRVGGERWLKVDVRVIAATRRNLDREVQEGRFRDDLFFRLAVARLELPPLRRRHGDVGVLARHFWHEMGGDDALLTDTHLARLEAYGWPGNVRELQNVVARQIALGELDDPESGAPERDPIESEDLIESVLARELPLSMARQIIIDGFERRYVARVLARYQGNVGRAAAALGIKRRYFQVLRARYRSEEDP